MITSPATSDQAGLDAKLQPQPWHPADDPPQPPAAGPWPLVLLIDRRRPETAACQEALLASLTAAERRRHEALRRSADQERFLLGRGGLRRCLGAWLDLAPQAVPIAAGPHGKPATPQGPAFNVSHSGALILLAAHPSRAVGVDVEQARPGIDWPAIGRRVLPAAQLTALQALPADQREAAFLLAWCRLEAQLKALGTGLAGLGALADGGTAPLLRDLALPDGHAGAVAVVAPPPLRDHPAAGAAPRP